MSSLLHQLLPLCQHSLRSLELLIFITLLVFMILYWRPEWFRKLCLLATELRLAVFDSCLALMIMALSKLLKDFLLLKPSLIVVDILTVSRLEGNLRHHLLFSYELSLMPVLGMLAGPMLRFNRRRHFWSPQELILVRSMISEGIWAVRWLRENVKRDLLALHFRILRVEHTGSLKKLCIPVG